MGLVDADIYGPSMPLMFDVVNAKLINILAQIILKKAKIKGDNTNKKTE